MAATKFNWIAPSSGCIEFDMHRLKPVLLGLCAACSPIGNGSKVSQYSTAIVVANDGLLVFSPPRSLLVATRSQIALYSDAASALPFIDSGSVQQHLPPPDGLLGLGDWYELTADPEIAARGFDSSDPTCTASLGPGVAGSRGTAQVGWGSTSILIAKEGAGCLLTANSTTCSPASLPEGLLRSEPLLGLVVAVPGSPTGQLRWSREPPPGQDIVWNRGATLLGPFLAADSITGRLLVLTTTGLQDATNMDVSSTPKRIPNSAPFLAAHIDGIVATPEEILGGVIGIDRTRPEVLYLSDGQWHRAGGRLVQRITAGRYIAGVGAILAADVKDDDGTEYAVLLKYDPIQADGPEPWRWFAILRDYHDVRALAPMAGGVAFGGVGGWGHFSRKTGLCVGDQALTKVGTLIPTGPASVFMAGEDNSGAVLYRRAAF